MPEIHQSLKVEAIVAMFYRAIAALHLMSSGKHQKVVMRNIVHRAIQVMEEAAHKCNFTFQNKVYLLEAELAAHQSKHKKISLQEECTIYCIIIGETTDNECRGE